MARIVLLLVGIALLIGALFLFSFQAKEVPVKTIETDVAINAS